MTVEKSGSDAKTTELKDSSWLKPFKLTYCGLSKTFFFPSDNMCNPNKNPWGLLMTMNFSNALIINSTDKDKGNHAPWRVWTSDKKKLLDFVSLISPSKSVCLTLYQTLVTVFHQNIKNLEVRQKYSATRRIFNSLLGVWYVMKHCVSCLIYYFNHPTIVRVRER